MLRLCCFGVSVVTIFFLVSNWSHPCGQIGGIVEQTNLNEHLWDSLPSTLQWCLTEAGAKNARPLHFISLFNTFWTILFEVQSRYINTWPDAPSYNFELEVEEFLGVRRAQYVGSGDGALSSALQALGVGYGDEVVVPTHTRNGVASSISILGGIPIMANIDETLGINPQTLPTYITPRTKGIIATYPCNITAIKDFADSKKLFLVEDVSNVFGSTFFGKNVGTFGVMGVSQVNVEGPLRSGGVGGLVWSNQARLIEKMGWAIENGLGAWGGEQKLPSYKRSFGMDKDTEDKSIEIVGDTPFASNCFRSPSEWTATFARNELLFTRAHNSKLVELKIAFSEALKPDYRALLQQEVDPSGIAMDAISLILKKEAHVKLLHEYLSQNKVVVSDYNSWHSQYLPNVPTLMKKVSFHSSGYPWMTDKQKKPLKSKDYDASLSIMKRTLQIKLGTSYSQSMIKWAAGKVNQGLDQIMQQ